VACCAFWGFQQILIKFASREIPPLWQASLRMAGATALLWLWCQLRGVKLFERDGSLGAACWWACCSRASSASSTSGLQHTSASRLTVFLYTSPFWVALLLPRFVPSEKLRASSGSAWSSPSAPWPWPSAKASCTARRWPGQWKGDAMGLAAGILWGLTTLAIRTTKVATASAEKSLFYQLGVTAAGGAGAVAGAGRDLVLRLFRLAWGSVFLQTAVGAFASYLAWMWMLRHYPATQMSTFTFLTPLFALVFGVVLLGEPLTLQLVLALVGVAAGIVLVSRKA
jgi:drug/metabolite transporter (DMT)-like permease